MFAVVLSVGLGTGWTMNGLRWDARYKALELEHARTIAQAERTTRTALEAVRAAEREGDEIAARLIEAEALNRKLAKERDHAILELTTGRACLDAGVVRLLNNPASPGADNRLPAASGNPPDADSPSAAHQNDPQPRSGAAPQGGDQWLWDGPAATDAAYATDTDIALWARLARDEHDACRARIDALRAFFQLGNPP
jgi:hypothetical protein